MRRVYVFCPRAPLSIWTLGLWSRGSEVQTVLHLRHPEHGSICKQAYQKYYLSKCSTGMIKRQQICSPAAQYIQNYYMFKPLSQHEVVASQNQPLINHCKTAVFFNSIKHLVPFTWPVGDYGTVATAACDNYRLCLFRWMSRLESAYLDIFSQITYQAHTLDWTNQVSGGTEHQEYSLIWCCDDCDGDCCLMHWSQNLW